MLQGKPSLLILSSPLGKEGRAQASSLDLLQSLASRTLKLCPHMKTRTKAFRTGKKPNVPRTSSLIQALQV